MKTQLIAIAALATLSAFAAHADEADGSQRGLMFNSTRNAAEVQAEARMPVRISNGSTGFIGVTQSAVKAADVKAQAAAAVRTGQTSRGEIGLM
ncbi:MAG: DUF4148 domain-containing protein [Burkholderiales bacterium]|nr:DUF4148 domain-containing protein [Burkholderiales bacterium]